MLTGKAVARAVRGHILIYNALTALLICEQFQVSSAVLKDNDIEDGVHVSFLEETSDKELRNIETGATGDNSVNTDNALVVGHNIISSIEGKYIDEFVFKRKTQVTSLSSKLNIKVNNEEISVDPQVLFQRLVTTANTMFQDVSEVFNTPFKSKKEIVLANGENKQNFINMLSDKMDNEEYINHQAVSDVPIASTAVRYTS
ncbi:unnamed protein product [Mytilus coruscus]|uniref:Uncharacterized protein n=1 Tax=Mytilus coruscus TaxID=42192 RepID=A0A6J8CG99_MYTCO|nr:unnamed protein product [Mytilus coruscus]